MTQMDLMDIILTRGSTLVGVMNMSVASKTNKVKYMKKYQRKKFVRTLKSNLYRITKGARKTNCYLNIWYIR